MDKKYISEILSIIKNSDIHLKEIEIRGAKYNDDVSDKSTLYIETLVRFGLGVSFLKSWIIENQLISLLLNTSVRYRFLIQESYIRMNC